MSSATCGSMTCTGFLPSRSKRQIRSPVPLRTSRIACGVIDLPPLTKMPKPPVWSSTVTSSAPIGIDGVSISGVRSPALRAMSRILARPAFGLPLPSAIESFTGMTLIERISAISQRHRAGIAAGIVLRAPVADADRRVDHDRGRLEAAALQRGRVDVGLERGAGLAQRVGRAVELAFAVVAAADHGAHRAVVLHQHRGGLPGLVFAAVLAQRILDRALRLPLQVEVDREPRHEHALRHGASAACATSFFISSNAQSR